MVSTTTKFPNADGVMAEKVRDFDWSQTPLGAIDSWPTSLRVVVDMLLASAFPKCLFWGTDLIAIYNDAYRPLTGNKPESLGQPFRITWSEAWEQLKPIVDAAWQGEPTFIEDYLIPLDRYGRGVEDAWFTFCYSPVRDESGSIAGIMDTVVETTGKVLTEKGLMGEQERLRQLFEQSPNFMTVLRGPDHVFEYANAPYLNLIGNRDIVGKTLRDALPEIAEQGFVELMNKVFTTGEAFTAYAAPVSLLQPDGAMMERYLDFVYQPIRDASGQVTSIFVEGADVTMRHLAEQAFQERDEALRKMNESLEQQVVERSADLDRVWRKARDVQVIVDLDGVFLSVSPAWKTILGRDPAEAVGRHYSEFIWPEDAPRTLTRLNLAQERGNLTDYENRYTHADGTPRWFSWRTTTEGDRIYAYGRDIHAEKQQAEALQQAEDALRQAQKMEAVGQLTGGIAHDFNNMLAVIMGSLDLLNRRVGDDARVKRLVDSAAEAARRAANLTQRLLAFSRQQPLRPESLNVNTLVAGMSDLLHHSLGSDIKLETVLTGGPWRTHADPNQLENVILNLSVNARDAMPEGGRLTIETQNAHLDGRYASSHLGVPAGQYVLIAISDTGEGMAPDVLAKAFEPFFTTKDVGKGTGLGLSQVYGFVKQTGGHVKIYSEPGQGTTVKIYLPRVTDAEVEAAGEETVRDMPMGDAQEVILVVDDEAAVRQVSVEALTELGYHVLEADGAAAALSLIASHPEISLLFTDIVMPDSNGRKLADAARILRPRLKVLYTTGYTRNAVVHNGVVDQGVELIGKPFGIDELAAKVRQMLDQ